MTKSKESHWVRLENYYSSITTKIAGILAGLEAVVFATVITFSTATTYHTCLYLWARDVEKAQASSSTAPILASAPLAAFLK
jgi:hypothetical protein